MAGLASDCVNMGLHIRKPVSVSLVVIMAILTAAHRAFELGRGVELRALSACEVMVGALQVLADLQGARIIKQMLWIVALNFA